jgi:lipopolysaccharide export system permease protein
LRGLFIPLLAITGATCVAMMLERALRLIHEMAATGADVSFFLPLLARLLPYYLNLALPASFMIALVLLVSRLDDNLELEAMLASGVSLARIAAPLVGGGFIVAAAAILAGGILEPHGRYGYRTLRAEALNAGRIASLEPGAFYQPGGGVVMTMDGREGEEARGVFIHQRIGSGRELVLTAPAAAVDAPQKGRDFTVRLGRGMYHLRQGEGGKARPVTLRFASMRFGNPLLLDGEHWARGQDERELTVAELVRALARGHRGIERHALEAELYSRLARAATIPLIPLLVLPLCFAAKKGKRGLGLLVGGVVLMACHHGINFSRNVGVAGTGDPKLPMILAGLFALAVTALFVASRHLPSHSPISGAARRLRFTPAQFRGSPGRSRTRRRTIGGYLASQYAKWTLAALFATVALLQMVDLAEKGEDFVARGMGASEVLRYVWLRLPVLVQQSMPIAGLAGASITFFRLSRRHEMIAIRSFGISQFRLLAMALPVAALLSLSVLVLAEVVSPRSQVALSSWWHATAPEAERGGRQERWFRIGRDIVRAGAASEDGTRLEKVTIFRRGADGLLSERIEAQAAEAGSQGWRLRGVDRWRFAGRGDSVEALGRVQWETPLRAGDVRAFFAATPQLSSEAALRSLGAAAPVDRRSAFFETRLHRFFAEPLAPLVMLLLALPVAFASARTGPSWVELLYAGGGGLLYLVCDGVLTVAAQTGMVAPQVGAWAAPALFGLSAATVLLYTER